MDRYRIEVNVSTVEKSPDGRLVGGRRVLTQQALLHAETDAEVLEQVGRYAESWAAGVLSLAAAELGEAVESPAVVPTVMP
jgi:hypothetical protein